MLTHDIHIRKGDRRGSQYAKPGGQRSSMQGEELIAAERKQNQDEEEMNQNG